MHGLRKLAAAALLAFALPTVAAPAMAAPPGGQDVVCDPVTGECKVVVTPPGSPGSPGNGGGNSPTPTCYANSVHAPVPCSGGDSGPWSNQYQCYLRPQVPQPPLSDPVWGGHTTGGIYWCTTVPPSTSRIWIDGPPPVAPTPEQLARQALATLRLPTLIAHRSPTEANSDHGTPYTWVNLWTWFWSDPASWTTLTARAASGGVWAQVTVTPTRLVITPGEGSAPVTCEGPGRAWTNADGNGAPTAGGCGYQYRHVTATPITATMTINWAVTWTGSGGTAGTLPAMTTQSSSSFAVEQIQVVTR